MPDITRHAAQSGVYKLTDELWLPRPIHEVFDFFADASRLELITPPWLHFHVLTETPITMRPGTLIDYKLRLHGVPIRWQTEISEWQPPRMFVDRQLRGPYRLWRHRHTFTERDGGTLVQDEVEYRVPGGALVHRWFVKPDLEKIFAYRQKKLREYLGSSNGIVANCQPV